ncbi:portal protein [Mycobacterium phage Phrappuccino]|uniref:Portal protein n=1 Tax=Mycobacterium phage Phrappuccino TaxID=2591223 RepID=A0A514DDN4_9CAUD|nr:portal protein [Mycobacterium phage Phrappuccino]QDH91722.1 portal protein [Mycobacterium phage Phrappuccino]QIQ63165.1 portal protein [Mycobacterium phage Settecandela]
MTAPEPKFPIIDRRGRTASGLQVGNLSAEMNRLRQAGVSLPNNPVQARVTATQMQELAATPGSLSETTRKVAAQMNRSRMASLQRTGADTQIAMPRMRQPLGTLVDKGVPIDIGNPDELKKARMWARMYYATHDLVPLLIDIYARFPLTGLEFQSDDSKIEKFFSEMFLNDLNYEDFLPNALGREYFIAGEVTTLGHFDEELGTWASEEVLDPDRLRVSRSLFVDQERVQLMVKDMVDALRNPPHTGGRQETRSEQLERTWQLEQLQKYHPEIIQAANNDDGLDISEGLWSRIVNRANAWDVYGTPPLMRSFRTLLMEESLNAAQDAVADRLYAPFIVATLGIENMGDGEPWIPSMDDLQALRDDMQAALMGDFKLYTHHMGLKIESVFGRESVPRFDQDYDRVDMKLMQAWGIGQALIQGGTAAAGTYASSALNREVCELNMKDFQRKATAHIIKRAEVIAEAQQFYAYEKKGELRIPKKRKVRRYNEDTGEVEVVEVPELLTPKVIFRSLNLRDEQTERQFIADLKTGGAPVSDKTMALNTSIDFDLEIQAQAEEGVSKMVAQAEMMAKAKMIIDEKNRRLPVEQQMPYPPDMIDYLNQTLVLRQQLAAVQMAEGQADMMEQQSQAMSPAGQLGVLPMGGMLPPGGPNVAPPMEEEPEAPMNRARPEISDDMREGMPRAASRKRKGKDSNVEPIRKKSWLEKGPSSYGHKFTVNDEQIERAVRRREVLARHNSPLVSDLVEDPGFYQMLNMGQYESQIRADWPEIRNGGAKDSADLLRDMVQQFEDITGKTVQWD